MEMIGIRDERTAMEVVKWMSDRGEEEFGEEVIGWI